MADVRRRGRVHRCDVDDELLVDVMELADFFFGRVDERNISRRFRRRGLGRCRGAAFESVPPAAGRSAGEHIPDPLKFLLL